jgi:tetratricopeptide (TPR) repeat protein
MTRSRAGLLSLVVVSACAARGRPAPGPVIGRAQSVELPVWRSPSDRKIFVAADPGDGKQRLFLVDTGADISVLSSEVAEELGLQTADSGVGALAGLGGRVPEWQSATLPALKLGELGVRDVLVAVGIPGVPERVGMAPLAGILGNNVWSQFQLSIDYPANVLELWRGDLEVPESASSLWFDGAHARTWATLELQPPDGGPPVRHAWTVEIDTGATGLLLYGDQDGEALPLLRLASQGEEPIFGVGAGEGVPLSSFMQETLRLPVQAVELGGARVEERIQTSWLPQPGRGAPLRLKGLAGHELFDSHRMVLDYLGRSIALVPSERTPEHRSVNEWALAQLKRARTPQERLDKARLLAILDEPDAARKLLERQLRSTPENTEVRVLLARLHRMRGDGDRAHVLLAALSVGALVDEGEIDGFVNSLWLDGDGERARATAEEAVSVRPEDPGAWVALADAAWLQGDAARARTALRKANALASEPDGLLLRRALVSHQEGDLHGAVTHLRRLLKLYPGGPVAPWMYAWMVQQTDEAPLAIHDLDRARARLHAGEGALDFYAAAYRTLGRADAARELMAAGLARDCDRAESESGRQNCEAWYRAVAGQELDTARQSIEAAVEADPQNHQYLDTLAVVLEAQGEASAALEAARAAARTNPSDVYLLWQAHRLATPSPSDG